MSVIPLLGRQRWEDCCELKADQDVNGGTCLNKTNKTPKTLNIEDSLMTSQGPSK